MTLSNTKEKQPSRRRTNQFRRKEEIADYIPEYLRHVILPYEGDFCVSTVYHPLVIAQLMVEGFLPIAAHNVLLPKLHEQRCVIQLPDQLHVSKSARKKSKRFTITINQAFEQVIRGCQDQHGHRCWLYPPLVAAFSELFHNGPVAARLSDQPPQTSSRVRMYSIEIWNGDSLVGGELGYSVGSVYTSLTGFSSQDSAGSVQLAALGRLLVACGFSMWDLGMEMEYKKSLGSQLMPRPQFVDHIHRVRKDDHCVLPVATKAHPYQAKDLIDHASQELSRLAVKRNSDSLGITSQTETLLSESSCTAHKSKRSRSGTKPQTQSSTE
eukprot:Nitzschia sp. Nitz4//scaffold62_size106224//51147//52121//NITZ4_004358-RA/size106224-processed-gene-0.54-mRNA-1//-1//CDS//3329555862//5982//frame0